MRKSKISTRDANALLKGKNILYNGFDTRMKKKGKEAEKIAKEKG